MDEYRIVCVRKPNRQSAHEHITHVRLEGSTDLYTREQIVKWVDDKKYRFFVAENGFKAYVGTRPGPTGKFIQTYADKTWTDNLLSLPECR